MGVGKSGAIRFEVGLGGRKDGVFAIPLRGIRPVGWTKRRAWVSEDGDGVASIEDEVKADAEEGGGFYGPREMFGACAAETDVGFDPNSPCGETVDKGEGKVGRKGTAGSFTPSGAGLQAPPRRRRGR